MDYRYAHQSTGWFYLFIHPFVHVLYRLLFRKIYLQNRDGVKPNTPVLLATNHPTAFIDPIFLCLFFDPPVYNMTRGDIFSKPFFRKIMESFNMFPVFRRRDGFQERDRNEEMFEFCRKKLLSRVAVNVFVEGEHHLTKRVLPVQKGIARIAFETYAQHRLEDLQIIPVGCNYRSGDQPRDEVKINVGAPLFVRDYWSAYEQNPNAAINRLCQDIHLALKPICYHIENPADDALAEHLLTLWRNDHPARHLPLVEYQIPRFLEEKKLLDRLNILPDDEKAVLQTQVHHYFTALEKAGIKDEGLVHPEHSKLGWTFLLLLTAPIAIFGWVSTLPIRPLIRRLTGITVKKREFYTSVLMGLALMIGGVYLLGLFITGLLTDSPSLITLALMMPIFAWWYLFWKDSILRWMSAQKAGLCPQRAHLLSLREAIKI